MLGYVTYRESRHSVRLFMAVIDGVLAILGRYGVTMYVNSLLHLKLYRCCLE